MGYRLREFETERKFSSELTLEAIGQAVSMGEIKAVLQEGEVKKSRERKLNMVVTEMFVIAMNIYTHLSIGHVMRKLAQGLRFMWWDPEHRLPRDSALSYRRYQLGARPLVALFHRVCRPMATPETPGAFLFGLRLMAIDGTVEDVPDTPAKVSVFGRHHSDWPSRLSSGARSVFGRMQEPRHGGRRFLAMPCKRAGQWIARVAFGRSRHVGALGLGFLRLRHARECY